MKTNLASAANRTGQLTSNASQLSLKTKLLTQAPIKPPLKWAGGKRWLVPVLRSLWQGHADKRYVEPLCGGLGIAIGLRPQRALLNDVNPHLVNFYRQVQRGIVFTIEMKNEKETFYAHRRRFNQLVKDNQAQTPEAAQLFYYLNRTCFNGLCRFNRSGEFNVPFGSYNTIKYMTDFRQLRDVLLQWQFTDGDFESLPVKSTDFIYADPPYDVEFTSYSAGGFSWQDQVRTAEWLASHPGPVVLSNQATDRIIELYQRLGFEIRYFQGPRRISCTGDRSSATEVVALKL